MACICKPEWATWGVLGQQWLHSKTLFSKPQRVVKGMKRESGGGGTEEKVFFETWAQYAAKAELELTVYSTADLELAISLPQPPRS